MTPDYRLKFQLVDETTGEVVAQDFCGLTTIRPDGSCESVDTHVAAMLRGFNRSVREEYERREYPTTKDTDE